MLKKLDYKNMKLVYQHAFCKLIRVSEDGKHNLEPLIFIEDQVNRLTQYLENKYGMNKSSCYRYQNYFEYDDEINTPYIFLYDYPIDSNNKGFITNDLFAKALMVVLELLKLENVTIMGISNGGMIGSLASISKRVSKVIALHAPIFGVPLLQRKKLDLIKKDMYLPERFIYDLSKLYINNKFGFMQENINGFSNLQDICNLDKIIFTNSDIVDEVSKNKLVNYLAYINYHLLGLRSDGIVTFDKEKAEKEGINFIEEKGISHFELGTPNYTNTYYERLVRIKK